MKRIGREAWTLGVLVLAFVLSLGYFGRRSYETRQQDIPSTYSVSRGGAKALYELYGREGLDVRRSERPFQQLRDDIGLLVIVEPLSRAVDEDEDAALREWVDRGGTALVVASAGWPGRADKAVSFDDLDVDMRPSHAGNATSRFSANPYGADVSHLTPVGSTRLVPSEGSNLSVLFADDAGPCVVTWKSGKGSFVVASDAVAPVNAHLRDVDNSLFFLNVAAAHVLPSRRIVLFDEYHQGFGASSGSERSLWEAVGAPARVGFWFALGVMLLAIYNRNRRFGPALTREAPSNRPSTEFVTSMAGLYRRAGASAIGLELLYRPFVRDLSVRVDAPPDAALHRVVQLAGLRFGWPPEPLMALLDRCAKVVDGDKLTETEMTKLALQIQDYRRKAELDRLS